MAAGALETNIALCKGIARRKDADVHSIIDSLASAHADRTALNTELLLRYLLQGVLQAHAGAAELQSWAAANAESLEMLLFRISDWKSAQLKGALLSFAVITPRPQGMLAIADVGAALVHELETSNGLIPSEDSALVLDFLKAVRGAALTDVLPYCTAIARLSRDKVLVDAARATAAAFSS
jgi:hypothetical protein